MNKEEFDRKYREAIDFVMEDLAKDSEIELDKFYDLVYFLENLSFFSPVFYDLIEKQVNTP